MNKQELQALATLTGGRMFRDQLLLPVSDTGPIEDICKRCHLEREHGETCAKFLGTWGVASPMIPCRTTRVRWVPYE